MTDSKATLSLRAIIDAIEGASEEIQWFVNVQTGETDCLMDSLLFDEGNDESAFEGKEWLSLPDRYERDDWRTMRDFAWVIGGSIGDELLDDIHGRGAFRRFRDTVEREGLLQSWYAYKDEKLCELAVEWLKKHDCPWTDDRYENSKRDWRELLPDSLKHPLKLEVLKEHFSVCQCETVDASLLEDGFCCITRTTEELSLVCETEKVPSSVTAREDGWRALKVCGPLDFGLVGILAKISSALAEADVPLFAVSTYDTDYVLVKDDKLETAIDALSYAGCRIKG